MDELILDTVYLFVFVFVTRGLPFLLDLAMLVDVRSSWPHCLDITIG